MSHACSVVLVMLKAGYQCTEHSGVVGRRHVVTPPPGFGISLRGYAHLGDRSSLCSGASIPVHAFFTPV